MVLGRYDTTVATRNSTLNLATATLAVYLVSSAYTPNLSAHSTLADVPVGARLVSQDLTNVVLNANGTIDADNVAIGTYNGVAAGVLWYVNGADEPNSFLLWFDNESPGLPAPDSPANGVNLVINTAGIAIL